MTEVIEKKKILIIGIKGGLAQLLARLILKYHPDWDIIGIDSREVESIPPVQGLKSHQMKFSRGNFENLFRTNKFDTVYHLARISHSNAKETDLEKRLSLNVMGTSRILDLCLTCNVKKVIILSTYHVYGALYDNSVYLKETVPLKASIKFPDLRDVVEMDQICTNWMWKNQKQVSTIVFRPCNIIGNQINNSMTRFLTGPVKIRPIDFNPMFQFIHEFDMANVLYQSLKEIPSGIYNVAPDDFIDIRSALDLVGGRQIPIPLLMGKFMNAILKKFMIRIPDYFIDYLKFSCLIDNSAIKHYLGDNFIRFNVKETLKLTKASH
jgi:UDP-glucose 4-epimerase